MKPYYKDDQATIYNCDCREVLPDLEPVDLLLTDPPYEQSAGGGGIMRKRQTFIDIGNELSSFNPGEYWEILTAATKTNHGYIFTSRLCLDWFIQLVREDQLNWDILIYGKNNPIPAKNYRYLSSFEFLFFFRGEGSYWNNDAPFKNYSKIKMVNCKPKEWGHPTEKEIGVLEQLLTISTKPGDTIVDPFMGSGTSLVAARNMKCNSIGIELEEKYCEIAAKRLSQGVLALRGIA